MATLWPGAVVHSYGSFMTGLSLPTSDLDLVLLHVPLEPKAALAQLAGVLQGQLGWVQSLNAIDTARVPVIKVVGQVEGKQAVVDITFDHAGDQPSPPHGMEGASTLHSGLASVDLLCHYVALFPALRPLTLVLKQILVERGLSSTYTGGLNSYCLVLMVVAFLQSRGDGHRHHYAQHQRAVHDHIATLRAHQRAVMEHIGVAAPELPPIPPLTRPTSSSLLSQSPLPPSSPLTPCHRSSFTLNPQSPAFQPSATGPQSKVGVCSGPPSPSPGAERADGGHMQGVGMWVGEVDLGVLLVELLSFYATEFDWTTTGIAVYPPPTMPHMPVPAVGEVGPEDDGDCFFPLQASTATLVLSDPFYPLLRNNLGKAVFGMWRVKGALEEGLKTLKGERGSHAATLLSRLIECPALSTVTG